MLILVIINYFSDSSLANRNIQKPCSSLRKVWAKLTGNKCIFIQKASEYQPCDICNNGGKIFTNVTSPDIWQVMFCLFTLLPLVPGQKEKQQLRWLWFVHHWD